MQALQHEYFRDAVDPLMPRISTPSRMLRKNSELTIKPSRDSMNEPQPQPTLEKKNSWFRRSIIGRGDGVVSPPPTTNPDRDYKPRADKRSTWHAPKHSNSPNGVPMNGAPMMILPSIKPVSPLSDTVSVQAARVGREEQRMSMDKERRRLEERAGKKIGRQLSIASTHSQNVYTNNGVQQAVDKLDGNAGGRTVQSPSLQKESFFSHLRKRARRLSGRPGLPPSPGDDDLEAGVGCGIAWGTIVKDSGSNRSSMLVDTPAESSSIDKTIKEFDAVLQDYSASTIMRTSSTGLRRHPSFPPTPNASRGDSVLGNVSQTPVSRTRRSVRTTKPRYETPDENDELVDEVLAASAEYRGLPHNFETPIRKASHRDLQHLHATPSYSTPSPQANHRYYSKGLDISGKMRRDDEISHPKWPTPPSEGDGGWSQQIYAAVGR